MKQRKGTQGVFGWLPQLATARVPKLGCSFGSLPNLGHAATHKRVNSFCLPSAAKCLVYEKVAAFWCSRGVARVCVHQTRPPILFLLDT